jgi:hypothetical protein
MGFALAGWCLAALAGKPSPITSTRQALAFGLLIAGCALTVLVNPYGLHMVEIWQGIMDGDLPKIIQEHAPLDPAKPDGWIVVVFGLVYVAVLVNTLPRWPRVTWLLPCIWFYLACTRIRHAPLFSITAALAIADMLPHTRWAARKVLAGSDLFQLPKPETQRRAFNWKPALLPLCVLVAVVCLQVRQVRVPAVGHGWARLDPAYWPVELLPTLRAYQDGQPAGTPIFNEYLYGGFLIYQTPGFRVFVDDRCELYGDKWLQEYVRAEWQDTAEHFRKWEATYPAFALALTRTGSGFDEYLAASRQWRPIQHTETATLYGRDAVLPPTAKRNDLRDAPDLAARQVPDLSP